MICVTILLAATYAYRQGHKDTTNLIRQNCLAEKLKVENCNPVN